MAAHFDPARTRASFDSFLLKRELTESKEKYTVLGGAAMMRLGTIVKAWLVGLHREIEPALKQCHDWLKYSIETNEDLGDIKIPAMRSGDYGLSHWMLHAQSDTASYLRCLDEFEMYFKAGGWREAEPDRFNKSTQQFEAVVERGISVGSEEILSGYLSDYLAACIQAEQYQRGARLYESVGGSVDLDPKRFRKLIEFGYWLCLERLGGKAVEPADYLPIGERVLRLHVEDTWLGQGQATRAATWLKILYWHSGNVRDPLAVVLKAYDLMPHVPRPAFL